MRTFPCPYFNAEVEMTDEREAHIATSHPDLLPQYWPQIAEVLAQPDQVRRSVRMSGARLFCRWYRDVRDGKYIVVVVVSEMAPAQRHWITTAYITRRLANGEIEWPRT